MPICTYLGDHEYRGHLRNADLQKLLGEVLRETGEDWRIAEHRIERPTFFRRRVYYVYELFKGVAGLEFQCINFARDGTDWSINTRVPAELVSAYLYGLLAGMQSERSRMEP